MSGAHLYGWDPAAAEWVKLQCNADGKLVIDPSEIFENPPTDGEEGKAPSSNWAYDHNADTAAHHTRYTDVEARAAIGNLFDSVSYMLKDLFANYYQINYLSGFILKKSAADTYYVRFEKPLNHDYLRMSAYKYGTGYVPCYFYIFNGTADEKVATEVVVDSKIATHAAISDAHHARYTDAEARAAVGYNGTKYWSCPGNHFDSTYPSGDDINKLGDGSIVINSGSYYLVAAVFLPHGAVVTSAIVYGNASAASKVWLLKRLTFSDKSNDTMATADINTADSSVSFATIDNSLYSYFFATDILDAEDQVWGAIITYTI